LAAWFVHTATRTSHLHATTHTFPYLTPTHAHAALRLCTRTALRMVCAAYLRFLVRGCTLCTSSYIPVAGSFAALGYLPLLHHTIHTAPHLLAHTYVTTSHTILNGSRFAYFLHTPAHTLHTGSAFLFRLHHAHTFPGTYIAFTLQTHVHHYPTLAFPSWFPPHPLLPVPTFTTFYTTYSSPPAFPRTIDIYWDSSHPHLEGSQAYCTACVLRVTVALYAQAPRARLLRCSTAFTVAVRCTIFLYVRLSPRAASTATWVKRLRATCGAAKHAQRTHLTTRTCVQLPRAYRISPARTYACCRYLAPALYRPAPALPPLDSLPPTH